MGWLLYFSTIPKITKTINVLQHFLVLCLLVLLLVVLLWQPANLKTRMMMRSPHSLFLDLLLRKTVLLVRFLIFAPVSLCLMSCYLPPLLIFCVRSLLVVVVTGVVVGNGTHLWRILFCFATLALCLSPTCNVLLLLCPRHCVSHPVLLSAALSG